jgi:predicted transcriptional regulator of viral defense system
MALSTYISENLTIDQLKLLKELNELEIEWFRLENLQERLINHYSNLAELVENLTNKGILKRAERGVYLSTNFNDANVIGTLLVKHGAIAYWSALYLHGLTSRFPNIVYVQTTQRKITKTIFGTTYNFITVPSRKFIGIASNGYGNLSYPISDIEKTIVDCFDLPQYSGGFDNMVQAFGQAKLNGQKLINYCKAIDNIAVTKRIGFLSELLQKKGLKEFISWARGQVNERFNPIDAGGPEMGEFENTWRLRLNVAREDILNLTNEMY